MVSFHNVLVVCVKDEKVVVFLKGFIDGLSAIISEVLPGVFPLSGGTAFYQFCHGTMSEEDQEYTQSKELTDKYSQDMTKWTLEDKVGNVFNRLILFNSKNYNMSMDYFGDNKYNGRLFQVFFFQLKYINNKTRKQLIILKF